MSKSRWAASPSELLLAGRGLRLSNVDPRSTPGFTGSKRDAEIELEAGGVLLGDLQERLFAESRFGGTRRVLLVLQAMDSAGKGGIVRHSLHGIDPQGVQARAFKAPTPQERRHDFLWRIRPQLPDAGYIGVFDRSHYEDVLIHRVRGLSKLEVIEERYGVIKDFEAELVASGITVIKVMLHISPGEQKARLEERLKRADKQWKYNPGDVDERALWGAYQTAYEIAIQKTSTPDAPWFVVPADRKFYARVAVQRLLIDALDGLGLEWPAAEYDVTAEKARLAAT